MNDIDWLELLLQEATAEPIRLTTKQFINSLSGEVKSVIEEISREQESFGNKGIFEVSLLEHIITIWFGDYFITFYFDDNGNLFDRAGNGQGHRYAGWLEKAAKQLMDLMRNA